MAQAARKEDVAAMRKLAGEGVDVNCTDKVSFPEPRAE